MSTQPITPVPVSTAATTSTGLLANQPATTTGYSLGALVLAIEIILRAFGIHYTGAQHDAAVDFLLTYGPAAAPIIGGHITKWLVFSPATEAALKRDLAVATEALAAIQGSTVVTAPGSAEVTTTVTPATDVAPTTPPDQPLPVATT